MDNLLSATKDIGVEQLVEGVNLYLDMLKSQEAVLMTMEACKKPASLQFLVNLPRDKK